MNCYTHLFELFFYFFHLGLFAGESWGKQPKQCAEQYLSQLNGVISSPYYPTALKHAYCSVWKILVPPGAYLRIHLTDLDIDDDADCSEPHCCRQNRLVLPGNTNDSLPHILCGRDESYPRLIAVSQRSANITYVYSNPTPDSRGFSLDYSTVFLSNCGDDSPFPFQCYNGTCLPLSMRCDRVNQCPGGEDELNCHTFKTCPKGELACSLRPNHCYKPEEHQCDGRFQCLFGEDEVGCVPGCEQRISCSNGEGCYYPNQRCDARADCMDESDEAGCPPELCVTLPDKRQCRNKRCIQARLWCDGSDDCGDSSDEESCLQNSVITAAMMGALVGGLFLVLAVGYTIRYYGQRAAIVHSHVASQLRLRHSVSLPAHIDDEFFHREPPPAYSVAVADVCLISSSQRQGRGRGRTRGRPLLSVRRQQAPAQGQPVQPKPPAAAVHQSYTAAAPPTNHNQSQSPADNLMSSTPPSTFCNDDTVQLISA